MSKRWVTFESEAGLWINQHTVTGGMGFCPSPSAWGQAQTHPFARAQATSSWDTGQENGWDSFKGVVLVVGRVICLVDAPPRLDQEGLLPLSHLTIEGDAPS